MPGRTICLAAGLVVLLGAMPAAAQLGAGAQRIYDDFQRLAPHRAIALSADGKAYLWAGSSGAGPTRAIEAVLKTCEECRRSTCTLCAINNVVLAGRDRKAAAPPLLPAIGRLRPEPYWENKGPLAATGLIVWSHGYKSGRDASWSAPQGEVANFTRQGYDLYRFDREWIRDWPGDATSLVEATRQAKAMGYRRVILA